MTQRRVARAMGWTSINSYGQMEKGGRWRATRETLDRLAKVFGCRARGPPRGGAGGSRSRATPSDADPRGREGVGGRRDT